MKETTQSTFSTITKGSQRGTIIRTNSDPLDASPSKNSATPSKRKVRRSNSKGLFDAAKVAADGQTYLNKKGSNGSKATSQATRTKGPDGKRMDF